MLREIQHEPKIIYFWMTQEERDSSKDMLVTEYQEWCKKNYRVCIFVSGKENITELTKALLTHNKKVFC